jgi:hypothetical protein
VDSLGTTVDLLGHVPDENSALSADSHDELLVRSNSDLGNVTRVTNSLKAVHTLIVAPDLNNLVFTARHEVLSSSGNGKSVDLALGGAVQHADGLSIEAIPVGDLAVGTSSQELRLIGVVYNSLKHSGLEHAHNTGVGNNVPDDDGTIVRAGDSLSVVVVNIDLVDAATVLLKRAFHDLGLSGDAPDADLTLLATGDDSLAVVGGLEGSNAVVVGIVDGVEELAGLGKEGTDLAIGPAGEDGLAVAHEGNTVALKAGNLDSEEFLSGQRVPDSNVVEGASGEQLGVARGEGNVVDLLVVAGVTELRGDLIGVAPVEGGLGGTSEEVGGISSERDGGNRAHNLGGALDHHACSVDLSDGAVTSADKHVAVGEELQNVYTELEKLLGWADSLVELADEVDLDDITGEGAEVGRGIVGVDLNALELTLNLASVNIVVSNLLGNKVASPDSHAVVVDSDELVVGVVKEFDLVGDIHTDGVTAHSLA